MKIIDTRPPKCGKCDSTNVRVQRDWINDYTTLSAICEDCGHSAVIDARRLEEKEYNPTKVYKNDSHRRF